MVSCMALAFNCWSTAKQGAGISLDIHQLGFVVQPVVDSGSFGVLLESKPSPGGMFYVT
jgi:hypothetical protein